MSLNLQGTGQGKLILFGEHAAVYGYPAIGVSLPLQTKLIWTSNACRKPNNSTMPDEDLENFIHSVRKTEAFSSLNEGFWACEKSVPREGGFGSSAALCVAMARILLKKYSKSYRRDVHQLAHKLEKNFHGTPSGIDTGIACGEGLSAWRFSKNSKSLIPKREELNIPRWNLIVGGIKRTSSTAALVEKISTKYYTDSQNKTREAIHNLGTISEQFLSACHSNPAFFSEQGASLVNKAHAILCSLGLSHPFIDKILHMARKAGALGGKMSGGGQGGAFYICAPNQETREFLIQELNRKLFREKEQLTFPLCPLDL